MENQPTVDLIPIDVEGEVLTVSSLNFADGLGIHHKNLLATITKYKKEIEADFGLIAFETRKIDSPSGKGRPVNVAHLTEDQALFVGSLSNNSKRVITFKATLVKSFAEARKQLQQALSIAAPALSSEQLLLIQLASQQTQLLATQQEQINLLRADLDSFRTGQRPPRRLSAPAPKRLGSPQSDLRAMITRRVDEYCEWHNETQQDAYRFLYKRLFTVFGIDVYRLNRIGSEKYIDALERYGLLNKLYSLVLSELNHPDE